MLYKKEIRSNLTLNFIEKDIITWTTAKNSKKSHDKIAYIALYWGPKRYTYSRLRLNNKIFKNLKPWKILLFIQKISSNLFEYCFISYSLEKIIHAHKIILNGLWKIGRIIRSGSLFWKALLLKKRSRSIISIISF